MTEKGGTASTAEELAETEKGRARSEERARLFAAPDEMLAVNLQGEAQNLPMIEPTKAAAEEKKEEKR